MTEKNYKKWDEIVNPALERSRKRKKSNPVEDEIAKAIGMNKEDSEGSGDIWDEEKTKQTTPGEGEGIDPPQGTEDQSAVDRVSPDVEQDPAPNKEGMFQKSLLSRQSFDSRGSKTHLSGAEGDEGDLSEEELRIKRKKKEEIERVMNEFVNWKEALK